MKEVTTIYDELTASPNFQHLSNAFQTIFPNPADFSDYVYSGGVNITRYLIALEEEEDVKAICQMIGEMLKGNGLGDLFKDLGKDKLASNFVEKWVRGQGVPEEVIRKFNKMSSRNRNFYSYFLAILIRYSVVSHADNVAPEAIAPQEEAKV